MSHNFAAIEPKTLKPPKIADFIVLGNVVTIGQFTLGTKVHLKCA